MAIANMPLHRSKALSGPHSTAAARHARSAGPWLSVSPSGDPAGGAADARVGDAPAIRLRRELNGSTATRIVRLTGQSAGIPTAAATGTVQRQFRVAPNATIAAAIGPRTINGTGK